MKPTDISAWKHEHTFGQSEKKTGERRTLIVIGITAVMMVVEIAAGMIYGSIALLADGIHMGSHATALVITAVAYIYARKQAGNQEYSFGTGKVNSLAGFSSAIVLGVFALTMVVESVERFINPVEISFNQAILVAIVGLVVNVVSALILNADDDHVHGDDDHHHHHEHEEEHTDHNLRSAYLHVLADAITSLTAIGALLGGKYLGWVWMDPIMGLVGAFLVSHWSLGLLKVTAKVLLDRQGPAHLREALRASLEQREADRVSDLHVWQIGPGIYSALASVVSTDPLSPDQYKAQFRGNKQIVHLTVEVNKTDR